MLETRYSKVYVPIPPVPVNERMGSAAPSHTDGLLIVMLAVGFGLTSIVAVFPANDCVHRPSVTDSKRKLFVPADAVDILLMTNSLDAFAVWVIGPAALPVSSNVN